MKREKNQAYCDITRFKLELGLKTQTMLSLKWC